MTRPVDAVVSFLEAEQARGVSHIYLDESARHQLRCWWQQAQTRPAAPAQTAAPVRTTTPAQTAAPVRTAAPAAPAVAVTGGSKAARLAALRQQAQVWQPARALGTLRETMVFAAGNPEARLMLVGEAPGYEEERKGEPFVGPAGQKLDDILKAMGLSREEVYISNIVKFRPTVARQATNNRPPTAAEIAACLPLLLAEIEIVRPACLLALGSTAAQGLLGLNQPVAAMRGVWHHLGDILARVTYHPSYLLRQTHDLAVRRELWEDMLMVMEHLQMPISEKQRGFFLTKS